MEEHADYLLKAMSQEKVELETDSYRQSLGRTKPQYLEHIDNIREQQSSDKDQLCSSLSSAFDNKKNLSKTGAEFSSEMSEKIVSSGLDLANKFGEDSKSHMSPKDAKGGKKEAKAVDLHRHLEGDRWVSDEPHRQASEGWNALERAKRKISERSSSGDQVEQMTFVVDPSGVVSRHSSSEGVEGERKASIEGLVEGMRDIGRWAATHAQELVEETEKAADSALDAIYSDHESQSSDDAQPGSVHRKREGSISEKVSQAISHGTTTVSQMGYGIAMGAANMAYGAVGLALEGAGAAIENLSHMGDNNADTLDEMMEKVQQNSRSSSVDQMVTPPVQEKKKEEQPAPANLILPKPSAPPLPPRPRDHRLDATTATPSPSSMPEYRDSPVEFEAKHIAEAIDNNQPIPPFGLFTPSSSAVQEQNHPDMDKFKDCKTTMRQQEKWGQMNMGV